MKYERPSLLIGTTLLAVCKITGPAPNTGPDVTSSKIATTEQD